MARRLLMHVGMPKTGTTTLQLFLTARHTSFAEEGMGVLGRTGLAGQHQLADWLREMDGGQLPPGFFYGSRDAETDHFPEWNGFSSLLISAEDMYLIAERGVRAVLDYAHAHDADCEVVLSIRNPVDWLWSTWTQRSKSIAVDWPATVEGVLRDGEGFLSRSLRPWLDTGEVRRVTVVSMEGPSFVERFLRAIGSAVEVGNVPSYNVGGDFYAVLYQATLTAMVRRMLVSERSTNFVHAESGFVQRFLTEVNEKAEPYHEMSLYFRERVREDPSIEERCIGRDSHELVAQYARRWSSDAREFLSRYGWSLGDASARAVEDAVVRADDDVRLLESGETFRRPFPRPGFVDLVPINASFVALARTVATAIILAQQVWERTTVQK